MSTALFLALHLVAAQASVEVETRHTVVELDGKAYLHVPKGTRLRAKVTRSFAGERLLLDVIRVGPRDGPPAGTAALRVQVGKKRSTVRARPPLEPGRGIPGARVASYPVRHRFPLPSGTASVVIDVQQGDDGVLVLLVGEPPRKARAPALVPLTPVPLEPIATKPPKKSRPPADTRRARGDPDDAPKIAASEREKPEPTPTTESTTTELATDEPPSTEPPSTEPVDRAPAVADSSTTDAPPVEPSMTEPSTREPSTTDPAPAGLVASADPAPIGDPPPSPTSGSEPDAPRAAPAIAAPGASMALPVRLSAQVAAGGVLQLAGGLQPALVSGGVRVVAGAREGWMSRYAFGLALDFEQQTASAERVRWMATGTRVRAEAEARVLEERLGGLDVDVTVLGGLGAILGGHDFVVDRQRQSAPLLGPTARVAVVGGLGLGPGALTVTLPLDVSVDTAGVTSGFAPITAGLYVGYRLDL